MYFATLDATDGPVRELALVPMRMRRFRLQRATEEEARWLQHTLDRESRAFGTRVEPGVGARAAVAAAVT